MIVLGYKQIQSRIYKYQMSVASKKARNHSVNIPRDLHLLTQVGLLPTVHQVQHENLLLQEKTMEKISTAIGLAYEHTGEKCQQNTPKEFKLEIVNLPQPKKHLPPRVSTNRQKKAWKRPEGRHSICPKNHWTLREKKKGVDSV